MATGNHSSRASHGKCDDEALFDARESQGNGMTPVPVPSPDVMQDINNAVEVMKRGGVILYPTDTVWGLGCDATNEQAVRRIFEIKKRCDSKSLIILIPQAHYLYNYLDRVPDVAFELIDAAVHPVTIVYDGAQRLAPSVVAADGSVGIRVTAEQVSHHLCRRLGRAVVSTSANFAGCPTAATFKEIDPGLIDAVDYVMTSRRDDETKHRASSVIKLSHSGVVKILRP